MSPFSRERMIPAITEHRRWDNRNMEGHGIGSNGASHRLSQVAVPLANLGKQRRGSMSRCEELQPAGPL